MHGYYYKTTEMENCGFFTNLVLGRAPTFILSKKFSEFFLIFCGKIVKFPDLLPDVKKNFSFFQVFPPLQCQWEPLTKLKELDYKTELINILIHHVECSIPSNITPS